MAERERPITFSSELVPRVLDGTKTQTRRFLCADSQHINRFVFREGQWYVDCGNNVFGRQRNPYGVPGDRLWIKEAYFDSDGGVYYRADGPYNTYAACDLNKGGYPNSCRAHPDCDCEKFTLPWKSGRFMPKTATRDERLEIVAVRVERLQEIAAGESDGICGRSDKGDAWKEGVRCPSPVAGFMVLWDKLNGKRAPWASNPWVWVIEFKLLAAKEVS